MKIRKISHIWYDIPGFPDYGMDLSGNIVDYRTETILNVSISNRDNTKKKMAMLYGKARYVHRLYAMTFIPNPNNLANAIPIDGDYTNITKSNIIWDYGEAKNGRYYTLGQIEAIFNHVKEHIHQSDYLLDKCGIFIHITEMISCAIESMKAHGMYGNFQEFMQWFKPMRYHDVTYHNYEISPFGIIRIVKTGKYMLGQPNGTYIVSGIYHEKKSRPISHHIAVASTYIENSDHDRCIQVNHKDGNKYNPCVWNLEWVTPKENVHHAIRTGLNNQVGEDHPSAKYSSDQIHSVCKLLSMGKYKNIDIEKMTGVNRTTITQIKNGKQWTNISSHYDINYIRYVSSSSYVKDDKRAHDTKTRILNSVANRSQIMQSN